MIKFFFLATLILNLHSYAYSQQTILSTEQIAFNYFIDSICTLKYPNIKLAYFKTKVNPKMSLLRQPLGFKDYYNIGNVEDSLLKIELKKLNQLDYNSININYSPSHNKLLQVLPFNKKKVLWKGSVRVEVFKKSIAKLGFSIVEVVVMNTETRTHFFVEINQETKQATRYYYIEYIY